jgi:nicotinate dehydrogenase subunit A
MTQTMIRLTVNGRIHDVDAAPDTALLYVLRNDLALNGPKYGCGLASAAPARCSLMASPRAPA